MSSPGQALRYRVFLENGINGAETNRWHDSVNGNAPPPCPSLANFPSKKWVSTSGALPITRPGRCTQTQRTLKYSLVMAPSLTIPIVLRSEYMRIFIFFTLPRHACGSDRECIRLTRRVSRSQPGDPAIGPVLRDYQNHADEEIKYCLEKLVGPGHMCLQVGQCAWGVGYVLELVPCGLVHRGWL
jgi:hypothetical protein